MPVGKLAVVKFSSADDATLDKFKKEQMSATSRGGWMVLSYSDATTLSITAQGTSSRVEDFLSHLKDDAAQYVLVRVNVDDELNRDVLIEWYGPSLSKIKRARLTEHMQDVKQIFHPFHISIQAFSRKGFDTPNVVRLSDASAGSHVIKADDDDMASTNEATQAARNAARATEQAAADASRAQDAAAAVVAADAAAASTPAPAASAPAASAPAAASVPRSPRGGGAGAAKVAGGSSALDLMVVSMSAADQQLLAKFKLEQLCATSRGGWMVFSYTDARTLAITAQGTSSRIEDFASLLKDDAAQYVLVRVVVSDEQTRDVVLSWFGKQFSKIKRAKLTEHQQDIKTITHPHHSDLSIYTRNSFNTDTIVRMSDPAAGTHVLKDDE